MQLPPAEVLLSWPLPNYVNPVTRGDAVLIVNIVTIIIATIVTCLRIFTRLRITYTPGLDDLVIVISLLFAIAMCVVISIVSERFGFKRHIWDIPMTWLPGLQKLNFAFQVLFSAASSTTKLSLLWFCKRLIGAGGKGLYRGYYIFLIACMVFVLVCWILFEVVSFVQCRPMKAIWDLDPEYPHTCINDGAAVFAASIVNVFNDLLCTLVPMPVVWNLKLPTRQRLAVMSIFGLGAIVNVAGAVRTAYVYESMLATYDSTWMGWPILLSATIEINLGLICASAPALRPLLTAIIPHVLDTTRHYYSSSSKRASKLWSPGPSKTSNAVASQVDPDVEAQVGLDGRMHVLRTVELESWTEPTQKDVGVAHTCGFDDLEEPLPDNTTDLKSGQVVACHGVTPSSSSGSTARGGSQPRSPVAKEFFP